MHKLKLFIKKLAQVKVIHYICINKRMITMKAVLGQYHYAPHRSFWGVWQWTEVSDNGGACGTFIKDFRSREEAREFVWQMNGWGKPRTKLN